jgi:Uncharacterized conserved protein
MSPLRGALIITVLIAAGAAAFGATPPPTLVVSDSETDRVLYSTAVSEGTSLELRYTHSVERSPVTERYRVTDGQLRQTVIIFESYGGGCPPAQTWRRSGGSFMHRWTAGTMNS